MPVRHNQLQYLRGRFSLITFPKQCGSHNGFHFFCFSSLRHPLSHPLELKRPKKRYPNKNKMHFPAYIRLIMCNFVAEN